MAIEEEDSNSMRNSSKRDLNTFSNTENDVMSTFVPKTNE